MDNVASVSCGKQYAAAVKTDGSLWVWGEKYFSHCAEDNSETPVKVMDNVKTVSCGKENTAAIKTDGSLWIWGDNSCGQLGNGTVTSNEGTRTPAKVMDNVIAVSCGRDYVAAITADNSLWMWGGIECNGYTEGNFMGIGSSVPVRVMDNVAAVSCDKEFQTIAYVKTDGTLWICGWDYPSEKDDTKEIIKTPKMLLDNVISVSLGNDFLTAIRTDGSLWTRGNDGYGQLGTNHAYDFTYTKGWLAGWSAGQQTVMAKTMDSVVAVSGGTNHTVIVKTDGSVWTCGLGDKGELGNLTPAPINSRGDISSASSIIQPIPTKISLMSY